MFEDAFLGRIADTLAEQGYIIIPDFLPQALAQALHKNVLLQRQQDFKPASIGRGQDQQYNRQVRRDKIHWLTEDEPSQKTYLQLMDELRLGLNQRLYLGLFDYESHYAHYAPGDFYHRHLDGFKGASNRVLSTVLYLNKDWGADDGGELLMYANEEVSAFMRLSPVFNVCLIFLSEEFPHEVTTAKRDRYSIAGWYRLNRS